jgi:glucose/arabinose dehydrogenase
MRSVAMFATTAIIALISVSAMAQTATTPATTTTPMATTKSTGAMPKQKTMAPPQSAVSKACSVQADAKGLHGTERSKFRSQCKKNGGKP